MIPLTVRQIAEVASGRCLGVDPDAVVTSVAVDSRTVEPGSMYVAIAGERVDGHDFGAIAVAAGSVVVLASRELLSDDGVPLPCVVVDDPVLALGTLARWVRTTRLGCSVVAITGSSGKTSTKDLLGAILSTAGETVSAEGSFNTEVGVPLTILRAEESTRFLVVEMGMRGEGHISYLADIAVPDVGVIVNAGSAHLGMLGSREAIARAKGEIVIGLPPSATAVLNGDDPLVRALADDTDARVITFGESAGVDVRATDIRLDSHARPSFTLHDLRPEHDEALPVSLAFSGEHYVSNALAAAAAALCVGVLFEQVVDGLRIATPQSKWRMEVRESSDGLTVINDAYNANPESMRAALSTLSVMAAGRRSWAVLGEMRELGDESMAEHDAIGRLAVRLGLWRLMSVGDGAVGLHLGAVSEGASAEAAIHVPDVEAAIGHLRQHLMPGDVVLVKASRSVGLETVAEALLAAARAEHEGDGR